MIPFVPRIDIEIVRQLSEYHRKLRGSRLDAQKWTLRISEEIGIRTNWWKIVPFFTKKKSSKRWFPNGIGSFIANDSVPIIAIINTYAIEIPVLNMLIHIFKMKSYNEFSLYDINILIFLWYGIDNKMFCRLRYFYCKFCFIRMRDKENRLFFCSRLFFVAVSQFHDRIKRGSKRKIWQYYKLNHITIHKENIRIIEYVYEENLTVWLSWTCMHTKKKENMTRFHKTHWCEKR